MSRMLALACALAAFALAAGSAFAPRPWRQQPTTPPYGPPITLDDAKRAMAAAELEAAKNSWQVAITILDSGGNLVMFHKIDNTQLAVDHRVRRQGAHRADIQAAEQGARRRHRRRRRRVAAARRQGHHAARGRHPDPGRRQDRRRDRRLRRAVLAGRASRQGRSRRSGEVIGRNRSQPGNIRSRLRRPASSDHAAARRFHGSGISAIERTAKALALVRCEGLTRRRFLTSFMQSR